MRQDYTRLVDENGKKPISLEKDELNQEDLMDSVFNLGWLDGFICSCVWKRLPNWSLVLSLSQVWTILL